MPKVSVIIPCYHSEEFISRCVDSILAQTFTDWEAIFIVDDYLADNTADIIHSKSILGWKETLDMPVFDERFVVITNKGKTNPATARNKGVSLAVGEYITFLDADDWWYPDKLETQVAFMDRNKVFEWCWAYVIMHHGKKEYMLTSAWDNPKADEMIPFQTFMLRRTLVDRIIKKDGHLLDESLPQIDDYDLFLRLKQYKNQGFKFPLSHYYIHDKGLTSSSNRLDILLLQIQINLKQHRWGNLPRLFGLYSDIKLRRILRPYFLPAKNRIDRAIADRRIAVQIEPTTRCNLHCKKCSRGTDTPIVDLQENTLLDILRVRHPHTYTVLLQGLGEPFMHPHFEDICMHAKQWCKYLVVVTNGTMTNLKALDYIDHIVVSIDTMNPVKAKVLRGDNYNFENVKEEVLALAKERHPTVAVNFVRTADNYADLVDVQEFCDEVGIVCHVTPVQNWYSPGEPEWMNAHMEVLRERSVSGTMEKAFRFACPFLNGKKFYYDALGESHPCCIRMRYNQKVPTKYMCETCPA